MSIIAYRRWKVDEKGLLRPVNMTYAAPAWSPDQPTRFGCLCRRFEGDARHRRLTLARPGYSCGIYSYKGVIPTCVCWNPTRSGHGVVGAVRIWGQIVEHEFGWRSEYAEPVAVVDFTGRLSDAYHVPRYPDLDSLYGEWAPDGTPTSVEKPIWCSRDSIKLNVSVDMSQFRQTVMDAMAASAAKFEAMRTETYLLECAALADRTTALDVLEQARAQGYPDPWAIAAAWVRLMPLGSAIQAAAEAVEETRRPAPKTGPPPLGPGHRAYSKQKRRQR